ncbi:glycoside hydrolase [Duganella sp. Leaf126]|uniref:glycoside hydrolase family 43 protein n=1 Tax=Duganella sp. Leaf126 TaxID=1736266 RepID=UPI0006FC34CC|nr:glycoside hydrolase 43 family protein [Duganella sp. Leaf126]KQQ33334.1 glycoside hydrolase [Duganella sp. Leaf126]
MRRLPCLLFAAFTIVSSLAAPPLAAAPDSWTPDNGNGTFTNPIFYDEFSDPDLIRVGDWFYLTGTTMHAMPGLPVLRSRDMVNWEFLSYAAPRLDYGPAYRLEQGQSIYGRGIWAPSLRYRDGTFYIFTNVNGRKTQVYAASDPRGPWRHHEMLRSFHDLSVLFDDDGKTYVVWDHQQMKIAELNADLTDIVPGTERVLFSKTDGMGEGAHFYKIAGKYYILSSNYAGGFRMPAARADHVYGPYEVNQAISKDEGFGMARGYRLPSFDPPFQPTPPDPSSRDATALHQGGIVQTAAGEWWGFSMMDYNSVGRLTSLAPVTWQDGWPYFGLPGNLGRNPRTWVKPKTDAVPPVHLPFQRDDDFSGPLQAVWQWNHAPADQRWSLAERPGYLRLHADPADTFWNARNSLTQRAIGPVSEATTVLDTAGMAPGDTAGLALLNLPYATLGVEQGKDSGNRRSLVLFDQLRQRRTVVPLDGTRIWLRVHGDFLTEQATFSYSLDGKVFQPIGEPFTMVFQLKTFQGVRYALFSYNRCRHTGGYADFDSFAVTQAHPRGLMRAIPFGKSITLRAVPGGAGLAERGGQTVLQVLAAPQAFGVEDMGLGRVALRARTGYLSIDAAGNVRLRAGAPGVAESFQWMETPTGELLLMALATNRYLRSVPAGAEGRTDAPADLRAVMRTDVGSEAARGVRADSAGPVPDGADGSRFSWSLADQ